MLTPGEVSGKHTPAARMGRARGRGLPSGARGPAFTSSARTLPDELLPKRNPASPGIVNSFSALPKMRWEKHDLETWPAAVLTLGPAGGGRPFGARTQLCGQGSCGLWEEGPRGPAVTPRPPPAGPQGRGTRSVGRPAPPALPGALGSWGWGTRGGPCPGQQFAERSPREPLS